MYLGAVDADEGGTTVDLTGDFLVTLAGLLLLALGLVTFRLAWKVRKWRLVKQGDEAARAGRRKIL